MAANKEKAETEVAVVEYVKRRLREEIDAGDRGTHGRVADALGIRPPSLTKLLKGGLGLGPDMTTCYAAGKRWGLTKELLEARALGRSAYDPADLPPALAEEMEERAARGEPVPEACVVEMLSQYNLSGPGNRADYRDAIDTWLQYKRSMSRILGPKLPNKADQSSDF